MSRYDILLWDLDQTLLDFLRSERYAIRHCFAGYGLEAAEEVLCRYSAINLSYWKRLEKGEISKSDVLLGRFITLFEEFGITGIAPEEFQEAYGDALSSVYYFQDDSYRLCQALRGRCRQYIVTNGVTKTQTRKLQLSGLDQIMDGIFISEQLGAPKPQKAYFDACFARIEDFDSRRAILVGDSLTSDMQGADNAGIAACWYNPGKEANTLGLRIDYEITDLHEILPILEGKGESLCPKQGIRS